VAKKELVDVDWKALVELLENSKEVLPSFRFHVYGTIEVNMPDEYANVTDVVEYLQQYGDGRIIHVESMEKAK